MPGIIYLFIENEIIITLNYEMPSEDFAQIWKAEI